MVLSVRHSAASLLLDSAQGRAVSPNRSFPFSVTTEYQALRFPVTWSNSSLSVPTQSAGLFPWSRLLGYCSNCLDTFPFLCAHFKIYHTTYDGVTLRNREGLLPQSINQPINVFYLLMPQELTVVNTYPSPSDTHRASYLSLVLEAQGD